MKKTIKYILGAVAAMAMLPSCVLDQESPSTVDGSTLFSNYDLAVGSIYGIGQVFGETNCYRGRFLPWYGFNTDIEWYTKFGSASKSIDGKNEIPAYGITSNNSQMDLSNGPYNMMYSAVERANLAVEGLREYGDIQNKPEMAALLGEALTLRAMIYYDLVKAWGDVPARFSPVASDNMYIAKSSRDVIFKQILADLDEAIPYLYYPGENSSVARTDRVNRLFAEGLYARIALMASGYALRPDDGCVGTGDPGSVRLSSDTDLSKDVLYPKALAHLKDAINSGKASLTPDYETLWRNFNNFDLTAGGEVLYSIPFSDARGRWNYTFAIWNQKATINGYTYDQGGVAGPVPTMWFKYGEGDVRRDLTCVNYKWTDKGIVPAGNAYWYFGKYRFEWMDNNPYKGSNDDGIKPVVMRYSDILLMAAEIENYLNGPTADAKSWLLQVRSRAYKGNESEAEAYVNSLSDKDAFFEAIVDERALEFCGEFLRKADLIRWNRLSSSLKGLKDDLLLFRDRQGEYSYLSGDIYYRLNDDEESLSIWGFGKNEQTAPEGDDWELSSNYFKYDDAKKDGLFQGKIDQLYLNDPDQYMFWPLFDNSVANSQGTLVNDYQYANK